MGRRGTDVDPDRRQLDDLGVLEAPAGVLEGRARSRHLRELAHHGGAAPSVAAALPGSRRLVGHGPAVRDGGR
jgi:hypothetical protein